MGPAIPLFIRFCDNVQKTGTSTQNHFQLHVLGTYKLIKTTLQRLGTEPGDANDKIFIYKTQSQTYVPLGEDVRASLEQGTLGL
jgi:hypothetical protein